MIRHGSRTSLGMFYSAPQEGIEDLSAMICLPSLWKIQGPGWNGHAAVFGDGWGSIGLAESSREKCRVFADLRRDSVSNTKYLYYVVFVNYNELGLRRRLEFRASPNNLPPQTNYTLGGTS